MTDIEKLKQIKEYFDGLALYFKDQTKEYKHPEDINPDKFVTCRPDTWNKRMIEKKRKKEAR